MRAERVIIETDSQGLPRSLPRLPPNSRVEAIFLIQEPLTGRPARRAPPPEIAGKGQILGDIVSPAIQESDWGDLT